MIILPQHLFDCLRANGEAALVADHDPAPVVKFFDPCGAATWLITECDPGDPDILFGLCDLGMGFPELGNVALSELKSVQGRLGIGLERDLFFTAHYPLSVYTHAARIAERITEDADALARSAQALGLSPTPHSPLPANPPRL